MIHRLSPKTVLGTALLLSFPFASLADSSHAPCPDTKPAEYRFSEGFSDRQGANHWYYKEWDGSSYTDMNWDKAAGRWKGRRESCQVWKGAAHPDTTDAVISWKAPRDGNITVQGVIERPSPKGDGTRARIMHNARQIWPSTPWQDVYPSFMVQHVFCTQVKAGEWIYFHLNRWGNDAADSTLWDPTIRYDSPPRFVVDGAQRVLVEADYPYEKLAEHARPSRAVHGTDRIPYVPYLGAGFNAKPWPDDRARFAFPTRDEWTRELTTVKADLQRLSNLGFPLANGQLQKAFTIYAWNEFGEGGFVAPTKGEGYMKLKAIQEVFSCQAATSPATARVGAKENGGRPLRVKVDTSATLGAVDLEGLRGVCSWQPYGNAEHPCRKAWDRAAFKYMRGIHLSCVDAAWKEEKGARTLVVNFEALDAALAEFRAMKASPLFMFAGMPEAIASQPPADNAARKAHPAQYVPTDYRHWDEYVSGVVQHLLAAGHRGGCYEVWNEAEDFHESWDKTPGAETLNDYLTLYVHTSRAIKAADPTAKVGGPVCAHWDSVTASGGAHSWGVRQFLRALAKYCREHPSELVPLDFVSWHDYCMIGTSLSDGVDFVDKTLAEVQWPARPEFWITEWNRDLGGPEASPPHQRASHAAWSILREAAPQSRRVARLYYYVLDDPEHAGEDVALVDEPPSAESAEAISSTHVPRPMNPSYAVFEMVRDLNHGVHLTVQVDKPLVALATLHEGQLRLMVNNNTSEARSALIELQNFPEPTRSLNCRIQRVDQQHSSDGKGLEAGKEITIQLGQDAAPSTIQLQPHATALLTLRLSE